MNQKQGFVAGLFILCIVTLYIFGLLVWSPFFLIWPRRYPGLTYFETVATRWTLVRHNWLKVTGH